MTPLDLVSSAVYVAAAGASGLAALQAFVRTPTSKAGQAVGGFFIVVCCNFTLNAALIAAPQTAIWLRVTPLIFVAALAPFLWLYVDDLTSDHPKKWHMHDAWPFSLVALGLVLIAAVASLPVAPTREVAAPEPEFKSAFYSTLNFVHGALVLSVVAQSTVYVWRILDRLYRLPNRLKRIFSDTSNRTLNWLWAVMVLLTLNWLVTILYNLEILDIPDIVFGVLGLMFTLVLGIWAATQKPVFQGEGQTRIALADDVPTSPAKYERSLLPDDRLSRIAAKIDAAFDAKALHLDPALSLRKLSEHLAIAENQLSQTFNRQLASTFYDYVNRRRIEAAKERLVATDETITDISYAVGFNSRSAFYNAFKAVTGQNPSDYRAATKGR